MHTGITALKKYLNHGLQLQCYVIHIKIIKFHKIVESEKTTNETIYPWMELQAMALVDIDYQCDDFIVVNIIASFISIK